MQLVGHQPAYLCGSLIVTMASVDMDLPPIHRLQHDKFNHRGGTVFPSLAGQDIDDAVDAVAVLLGFFFRYREAVIDFGEMRRTANLKNVNALFEPVK